MSVTGAVIRSRHDLNARKMPIAFPLKYGKFYTMITPMEERIGSVIRFFDKTSIAAVKLEFGDIAIGDTIHIKGHNTDFIQKIDDLEFDHHSVQSAGRGQFIGIKLAQPVKPFDLVYKVSG
jgi:putative protease